MTREDTDGRIDPDALLKAVIANEDTTKKGMGHLKIFFGYAAGVGKTYSMLMAAHAAKRRGIDVVAGYVEPHDRPETSALLSGLESLPVQNLSHGSISLREFDINAALERSPQLILIDELAHTNAPGSRHAKRYQDVEELLRAGIDVYTTVNVQHIESLNDIVASVTGVIVRERIPDKIFDEATQVELMDIEPEDLLERLRSGRVYHREQAERAVANFFTEENLTALREIALRRCADRTGRLSSAARVLNNRDYHTSEHILVCLSPSPTNPRIIRTASRMANAYRGTLTALFVENPRTQNLSEEDRKRLHENMALAKHLGAQVETIYGDDVALQIAEFSKLSGVSEIVMGRNNDAKHGKRDIFGNKTLTDELIAIAPNLDVHIIPDESHEPATLGKRWGDQEGDRLGTGGAGVRHIAFTLALLGISTLLGIGFRYLGFVDSSIISLYILATLLTAVTTTGRFCTLLSSALSVALYNFCFVTPVLSFQSLDTSYLVTFLIMFITAVISSELTSRINRNARQSAKTAFRTRVLLETNQMFQQVEGLQPTMKIAMDQLVKLLSRDIVFYPVENGHLGEPMYAESGSPHPHDAVTNENERAVATWSYTNNKRAGASTSTLPEAQCLYLAVRTGERVFGVIGIVMGKRPLDTFENSIMLSIIGECALVLAREEESRERQEAAIIARNEQLRANLLRSIGHDLRTPLTAISGSASLLREADPKLKEEQRRELVENIHANSLWLIDIVENLLTVTRIEDGSIHLNLTSELLEDVLSEAAAHLRGQAQNHQIEIAPCNGFLLARMDVDLVMQLLVNLIGNAIKYTPSGSTIELSARREGSMVRVQVADNGPGIDDVDKPHIFDRFYTSSSMKSADSHRSFGLGLSLCRSITEAHGGTIEVHDNRPHGAVFSFTLPAEEVAIHE
ncbi:MAG: sensor histidine kinase KdpD [Collinsella sp.]|nr:sensor histidine kinase KdpD [Collinsella sp.]